MTRGIGGGPVQGGICRMIEKVEEARREEGVEEAFRMTIATSDGETIYAARYASHDAQPSLYHNAPGAVLEADRWGTNRTSGRWQTHSLRTT